MINRKSVLAIIPARGGSKRLPRKNVLNLAGKPLIAWTIETSSQSKYIDRTIVSTDDDEIVSIAKQYGADVPFLRPDELASDEASSIDVVLHSIQEIIAEGERYDYVVLLQPTSPLRNVGDVDGALEQLIRNDDNCVISVCESEHSPLWANTLPKSRSMTGFLSKEIINVRSQDLPTFYRLNGAVYIISVPILSGLKKPSFFLDDKVSAYLMPSARSIDIDSNLDFMMAELLLAHL